MMSKINTVEELTKKLDNDLAWRKKEISYLREAVKNSAQSEKDAKDNFNPTVYLSRAGFVLLYAHWEGFIKKAAENYLEFVAAQKLRCNELVPPFLSLALKKASAKDRETAKETDFYINMVNFMLEGLSNQAEFPSDSISTKSNLNSKVLTDILRIIDIDHSEYESTLKLIDSGLVEIRNAVAHGERRDQNTDQDKLTDLSEKIFKLIANVQTKILNAAEQKAYKKHENDKI